MTIRGHSIDQDEFVIAWQTSDSVSEVVRKLGLAGKVDNADISGVASRFRANGIPLKKFQAAARYDYDRLMDLVEWIKEQKDVGVPDERITIERFEAGNKR